MTLAPESYPALIPFFESSTTAHSEGSSPSPFAAIINMSGAGFPFFTISPVMIKSKSSSDISQFER